MADAQSSMATQDFDASTDHKRSGGKRHDLRAEMIGLVLLFAGLAIAAALATYAPHDMEIIQAGRQGTDSLRNVIGPVGARIADLLLQALGLGAFGLCGLILLLAAGTLTGRLHSPKPRQMAGVFFASLSLLVLLHLYAHKVGYRPFAKDAAGILPGAVAVLLKALLSTVGTSLLASIVLAASLAAVTGRSLVGAAMAWFSGRAAPVVSQVANSSADVARDSLSHLGANLRSAIPSFKRKQQMKAELLADPEYSDSAIAAVQAQEKDVQFTVAQLNALFEQQVGDPVPNPKDSEPPLPKTAVRPVPPISPMISVASLGAPPVSPSALNGQFVDFPRGEPMAPPSLQIPTGVRRAREVESVRIRLPDQDVSTMPTSAMPIVEFPRQSTLSPLESQLAKTESEIREELRRRSDTEVTRATPSVQFDDLDELPEDALHLAPLASDMPLDALPPPVPGDALDRLQIAAASHAGPRIVETEALRNAPLPAPTEGVQGDFGIDGKRWILPPSTIVQEPPARVLNCDNGVLRENATVLEQKLADFNILGEVTDIRPGPVVTTYEYRPAPGIKISKIVNLRDDLTMSLSALRVRVVAPIPGRDVVGIEVPNKQRQMVYFREVVDHPSFRDSPSLLTLILGKDIEGRPICTDLTRAPHLLVAGATGTGKSVGINSFISSILFRATPEEVKFILIDPKILELSVYEGIPHLLLPVIDEPRKAELALKWAVQEMDRRYRILAAVEVRNLAGYKAKLPELRAAAQRRKALALRPDIEGLPSDEEIEMPADMPYIVIVIDEFADLIMAAGKEVEIPVARLAQKARAAGIHVILATQRPSVDVITGMIKANFPTRVSFQVASAMDSKVVLNSTGAETLLGKGDMLFVPPGEGHLRRCHGTWITDEEVVDLANHWKHQGAPVYDMDILRDPELEASAIDSDDSELDALYDEAVQTVIEANQASVSFLQRKLGIGYGRSARMIDTMEKRGLVGPSRGPNKPREILVRSHDRD